MLRPLSSASIAYAAAAAAARLPPTATNGVILSIYAFVKSSAVFLQGAWV